MLLVQYFASLATSLEKTVVHCVNVNLIQIQDPKNVFQYAEKNAQTVLYQVKIDFVLVNVSRIDQQQQDQLKQQDQLQQQREVKKIFFLLGNVCDFNFSCVSVLDLP